VPEPLTAFLLAHPKLCLIVTSALSGALAAARIDYVAFQKWQTPDEAWAYNWKIARWRWFQGAVTGAVPATGIASLLGG
jgi:hypothetical protein